MKEHEERQQARTLLQRLDKIGSPPPKRRKKYRSVTVGFIILVVLAVVVLVWWRTADKPSTGSGKVYPDKNGNYHKPTSGQ